MEAKNNPHFPHAMEAKKHPHFTHAVRGKKTTRIFHTLFDGKYGLFFALGGGGGRKDCG